jgi:protein disulfide-isomerase A6
VKYVLKETSKAVKDNLAGKSSSGSSSKSSSSKSSSSGSGSSGSDKDEVIVLDQTNFNALVLQSKDIWIVEFYAPWCGHCKALEPEYKVAAAKLKGQVKLGKVDATQEEALAARFGVRGYPTIKVFDYGEGKSDSKAYDYPGQRTAQDIINFASDLAERADIEPDVHELVSQKIYD